MVTRPNALPASTVYALSSLTDWQQVLDGALTDVHNARRRRDHQIRASRPGKDVSYRAVQEVTGLSRSAVVRIVSAGSADDQDTGAA